MSRRSRHREADESEVNMTPMLDVVFIMLIFFIVTASFVKEAGIDITRPPAATAERKERGNILVAITESGEIWIDRRQVEPRGLRAAIELESHTQLFVRMTTQNFEEATRARKEGRKPEFRD